MELYNQQEPICESDDNTDRNHRVLGFLPRRGIGLYRENCLLFKWDKCSDPVGIEYTRRKPDVLRTAFSRRHDNEWDVWGKPGTKLRLMGCDLNNNDTGSAARIPRPGIPNM